MIASKSTCCYTSPPPGPIGARAAGWMSRVNSSLHSTPCQTICIGLCAIAISANSFINLRSFIYLSTELGKVNSGRPERCCLPACYCGFSRHCEEPPISPTVSKMRHCLPTRLPVTEPPAAVSLLPNNK